MIAESVGVSCGWNTPIAYMFMNKHFQAQAGAGVGKSVHVPSSGIEVQAPKIMQMTPAYFQIVTHFAKIKSSKGLTLFKQLGVDQHWKPSGSSRKPVPVVHVPEVLFLTGLSPPRKTTAPP